MNSQVVESRARLIALLDELTDVRRVGVPHRLCDFQVIPVAIHLPTGEVMEWLVIW